MVSPYATLPKPLRIHADRALEAHNVNRSLIPGDRTAKPVRYTPKRAPFTRENYRLALGSYFGSIPKPKRSPEWLLAQPKDFQDVFWDIAFNRGDRAAAVFLGATLYDPELHPEEPIDSPEPPTRRRKEANMDLPAFEIKHETLLVQWNGMFRLNGELYVSKRHKAFASSKFLAVCKSQNGIIKLTRASASVGTLRRSLFRDWSKISMFAIASIDVYPIEVV
jgi:hypothetical protein